jgi:hypothetical protein
LQIEIRYSCNKEKGEEYMVYAKDELLENMNLRMYEIRVNNFIDLLKKYREDKILLQDIINISFGINIDFTNHNWRSEVKNKFDINKITKEALDNEFNSTHNPALDILNRYITIEKKVNDFENLYKQLNLNKELENELIIKRYFAFGVNKAGNIQPISPTFSGLSKEEIQEITGFWEAKEFSSTEEIMKYLYKYKCCLIEGYSSNYLIKGTVLYITIYPSEKGLGDTYDK